MAAAQYDAALLFYIRPEATSAAVTGVSPRAKRGKGAKAQAAEQAAALGPGVPPGPGRGLRSADAALAGSG